MIISSSVAAAASVPFTGAVPPPPVVLPPVPSLLLLVPVVEPAEDPDVDPVVDTGAGAGVLIVVDTGDGDLLAPPDGVDRKNAGVPDPRRSPAALQSAAVPSPRAYTFVAKSRPVFAFFLPFANGHPAAFASAAQSEPGRSSVPAMETSAQLW